MTLTRVFLQEVITISQDNIKISAKDKAKDRRLYATYGIRLTDWEALYEKQGGKCWICQNIPKSGILCVDHRHVPKYKKLPPEEKAKEVRALLCYSCNKWIIGAVERPKRSRFILEQIVKYFQTFKCKGDE